MERSSTAICCSVAATSAGPDDSRLLPSMARKSEVKLFRSPSARVFGSHTSATSADRALKLLRRQMLNRPSTTAGTVCLATYLPDDLYMKEAAPGTDAAEKWATAGFVGRKDLDTATNA